jgi:hypothetical protein
MEAGSLYLVAIELMLAAFGSILFLSRNISKTHLLSKAEIYVVLLTVISILFWLAFADVNSRWLSLKAALFVSCLYLSSKFPRQAMLLLATLALTGFLLDDVAKGVLFSKHIGQNANQILAIPFLLITCAGLLYRSDKYINLKIIYFVAILEMVMAYIIHARAAAISAIVLILILSSLKTSKIFLKVGQWIPLIYTAIVVTSYYVLVNDIKVISKTPSNIERSSMTFAAVDHFFDYPFKGPRVEFDKITMTAMDAIDCSNLSGSGLGINGVEIKAVSSIGLSIHGQGGKEFSCTPYSSVKGIDPHNFLLSIWRDEGAVLTLLWILAWFYYWNSFRSFKPRLDDMRMRLVIGMLAISVVQFSLAPPSTGMRLMIALIMGSALGFADKHSSSSADADH